MVNESNRQAASCPSCAPALVVNLHTVEEIACMTNVESTISATEDIDEEGICWRRYSLFFAHSMRFAYSGHSTRCSL